MKNLLLSALLILPLATQAASVSRAQFTTAVNDREPVDQVVTLDSPTPTVSFFSELNDLQNQSVSHQWFYNDKLMYEKSFAVKGPRWRVWTRKTLNPGWTGDWTVKVVTQSGTELRSESFLYQ